MADLHNNFPIHFSSLKISAREVTLGASVWGQRFILFPKDSRARRVPSLYYNPCTMEFPPTSRFFFLVTFLHRHWRRGNGKTKNLTEIKNVFQALGDPFNRVVVLPRIRLIKEFVRNRRSLWYLLVLAESAPLALVLDCVLPLPPLNERHPRPQVKLESNVPFTSLHSRTEIERVVTRGGVELTVPCSRAIDFNHFMLGASPL